ncbi:MAG: sugar phosphate isomerase/epimerase family protein [Bacteroidota bacterium]
MITFAVSTWLWTSPFQTETTDLFPKIKAMGFDAVEIPIEYPDLIDGKEILQVLRDHDLKPIACAAFGPSRDLTHADPKVHQNCFDYIEACFALCQQWEVDFLAGPMYAAVGKARMLLPEARQQEWQLAVHNLRKVCEMAETYGQKIALEPLNRFETDLVNTTADMVQMIKDIDHPAAGIMLDGFHMNIEEKSIPQAIQQAGDLLLHVQVSENDRGCPGTGQTDWAGLRDGLQNIDYKGAISIESFTPEIQELAEAVSFWRLIEDDQDGFAREGLAFLQNLFDKKDT